MSTHTKEAEGALHRVLKPVNGRLLCWADFPSFEFRGGDIHAHGRIKGRGLIPGVGAELRTRKITRVVIETDDLSTVWVPSQ